MGARDSTMRQIPLDIGLTVEPSFDTFVAGASAGNAAAVSHLLSLRPGAAPAYLWGPAGSGKTHLMRALVARQQALGQRCGWFNPGDAVPWRIDPGWSLVVIDDADRLDASAQQAAFALLIDALEQPLLVAAAGRLPPVDLPLRDDLRTRLAWGHVFALQPLSDAETRAALRREGDRRGILLPDELMDHLLTHFPRDLGHLMNLFDRLDTFALAEGRRLTVPLLRRMLAETEATRGPADGTEARAA